MFDPEEAILIFALKKNTRHKAIGGRTDGLELKWRKMMESLTLFDLPGFAEAKEYLENKGLSWKWITEVVDISNKYAINLKGGRPFYKSDCPHYKGYWLDGGIGKEN